jgi:cell fate (sporulation/competence/biofilm development) regulator YlbF (YheA/YmcA/DUF963 family)
VESNGHADKKSNKEKYMYARVFNRKDLLMEFYKNLSMSCSIEELNTVITKQKYLFNNLEGLKKILQMILNPPTPNYFWTVDSIKDLCSYLVLNLRTSILQHVKNFAQLLELPRPAISALFCQPGSVFLRYIHEPHQLSELARTLGPSPELELMMASINLTWFMGLVKTPRDLYTTMHACLPLSDHTNFLNALDNDWLKAIYLQADTSVPDFKQFAYEYTCENVPDSTDSLIPLLNKLDNKWLVKKYSESETPNQFKENINKYLDINIALFNDPFKVAYNLCLQEIIHEIDLFLDFKNTEKNLKIDNTSNEKPIHFNPKQLALWEINDFESYILNSLKERMKFIQSLNRVNTGNSI